MLPLIGCDDDNQILIFQRGDIDTKNFGKIRKENETPITIPELFYFLKTITTFMKELGRG